LLDQAKSHQINLMVVQLDVTQDKSVEDAILKQVDMPNGTRPLRTVVDKMMGGVTEIINETSKQVQAGVLQNFGLSELNINN
jgi:hypothetical protein